MAPDRRTAVLVGILGLLVACLVCLRVLAGADWDPSVFTAFGEEDQATRVYAEERLGEVHLRTSVGHDGRFFFVQANDPWVVEPSENAAVLDRPLYRSQRMLYPVLASAGGLLTPEGILWGLLIVNLVTMGFGTWSVAALSIEMGGSAWWGLAFTLNLGFVSELTIDGAGVVSAALAFLAVGMVLRDKMVPAWILLSLAVLTREAMGIAAVGIGFWLWRNHRRRDGVLTALLPAFTALAWGGYLRLRLGFESGLSQVHEFGLPFEGFLGAFGRWLDDPIDLAVGVSMLLLMGLYTWRTFTSGHLLGWAFIGFVPLGVLFSRLVWTSWADISRAIAPIITAYVVLLLVASRNPRPGSMARGDGSMRPPAFVVEADQSGWHRGVS